MYRWRTRALGLGDTVSVQSLITSAAAQYNVPAAIALAVANRESGFNQAAVGTSGELGVFQLMAGTASDLGVNASDLQQNIDGGVRYLSQLYNQFGNWFTALEAYNGGQGNVTRGTVSSAAQSYAGSVLASAGFDASGAGDAVLDPSELPADLAGGDWFSGSSLSQPAVLGLTLAGAALLAVAISS